RRNESLLQRFRINVKRKRGPSVQHSRESVKGTQRRIFLKRSWQERLHSTLRFDQLYSFRQSTTQPRLECSYLSTNNFYTLHAPQERGSTLEKVSLLPERTLLRRSLLQHLRPMPGLLPRNPCHSPTSENCPLKPR